MAEPETLRLHYWDAWRGAAIIAVIFVHVTPFDGVVAGSLTQYFLIGVRQLVNFGVGLFLALSGFMAARSRDAGNRRFISSKLSRILPPYFIWCTVFIALYQMRFIGSIPHLLVFYFGGQGLRGIGYFIILLCQMIVLTPWIASIKSMKTHVAILIALSLLGLICSYLIPIYRVPGLSIFPFYMVPFFMWYPFYHLGFLAGRHRWFMDRKRPRALALAIAAACAALALCFVEALYWRSFSVGLGVDPLKLSSRLFVVGLCAVALLGHPYGQAMRGNLLSWLGRNSYAIYLVHLIFVLAALEFVDSHWPLPPGSPQHIAAAFLLSAAIFLPLIYLARRLLPRRAGELLLG